MSNSVAEKPKQPGVIPYILSPSCEKHIKWLENVFDARQTEIYHNKDKTKIMHVSLAINDGLLYMADSSCDPERNVSLPKDDEVKDTHGFWCHVELENPEVLWKKALANGSTVVFELEKQYYGGELGCLRDPFGFNWGIGKSENSEKRKPGVTPYFFLPDGECEKHIEWMEKALGAKRKCIHYSDDKKIVQHCELNVNGSSIYTSDISGLPGTPEGRKAIAGKIKRFFCHMNVKNAHALWDDALKEEAKVAMELKKQDWGDEYGMFKDPFDFEWGLCPVKSSTAPPAGVIPYLFSPDCDKHVDWIKNVFGGEVGDMYRTDDKKIMHCSVKVNNGFLYMCDSSCTQEFKCPPAGEPGGYLCHVNLADPDEIWKKAMASGATQIAELKTQFWGDYYGSFKDPYGFKWAVMKAC